MKKISAAITAIIIALFICAITFSSCEKKSLTDSSLSSPQASSVAASKVTNSNGWTEYRIDPAYENNYAHWCQTWLGTTMSAAQTKLACGPTAYMLAAHMLLGSAYPCSGAKLDAIVKRFANTYGSGLPLGLTVIPNYLNGTDAPALKCSNPAIISKGRETGANSQDRNDFKAAIETQVSNGFPLLVPVNLANATTSVVDNANYTSENQSINPDIDGTDVSGRTYYLTGNSSPYAHFIVVIAIKVNNSTGAGYVYYKDPLASTGSTKVVSYVRFLNSALINGPNGGTLKYYDAMPIRK